MKTKILLFITAILLMYSCQKDIRVDTGTNPDVPPVIIKDSLTIKSIKQTVYDLNGSISIQIDNFYLDTILNKIKQVQIFNYNSTTDSLVRVYSYNNKKQIISIEDDGMPNIEFTRDALGKLLTSTTHYQGAIISESTGTFTYGTQSTGFTIAYLDSILKYPGSNPYDARSFYRYTFLADSTVASYEEFYISTSGAYRKEEYSYDNNKNLIAVTNKDTLGNILNNITYLRDAAKHTSLTSFFERLAGDLFWFYQTKRLSILPYVFNEFDYPFALSAPKKIIYPKSFNGSVFSSFANTYDSRGNLITTIESNDSGAIISKTEITYNP